MELASPKERAVDRPRCPAHRREHGEANSIEEVTYVDLWAAGHGLPGRTEATSDGEPVVAITYYLIRVGEVIDRGDHRIAHPNEHARQSGQVERTVRAHLHARVKPRDRAGIS